MTVTDRTLRLYAGAFLMVMEEQWYRHDSMEIVRRDQNRYLQTVLFAAPDAEAAYGRAMGMVGEMSDANCDGEGDRTEYFCEGLNELEEVFRGEISDLLVVLETHGIDIEVAGFPGSCMKAKAREELQAIRFP